MSEIPRCDYHIHTAHVGCANETMQVPDIVAECERLGVESLGITDHLNTLDQLDLHRRIREDIEALDTDLAVYFGAELNFDGPDGDFAFSEEIKEEYGFQFAIGGIHSPYLDEHDLEKMVEIQHRHHLKTCRDPLVDVLVHPYWFHKGKFDERGWPWFDSMEAVPEAFARELGQVARETGTAIEINTAANLESARYSDRYKEEYVAYLAILAEEGPCFATASDAHDIEKLGTIGTAWKVAAQLGLTAERIWRPQGAPLAGGHA